jgi:uncharacterized protein (TIRG00374 family)
METGDDLIALEQELVPGKKKNIAKDIFWFIVRIGLTGGIIGWLISSNYDKVVKGFSDFNYIWLLPAAFCFGLHMVVCGWRWYKLAQVMNTKMSLADAISLTMKAYFFSLVIPGGAIGGDLAKIAFLNSRTPKGAKIEGTFTILMDRIVGMVGLFSTAIVVILLTLPLLMSVDLSSLGMETKLMHVTIIILLLGMCLFGLCAMLAIFYHKTLEKIKPIGWLMQLGDKHGNNAVSRMTAATDLYRSELKLFLWMTVVTIIFVDLNLVVVVYFIAQGLAAANVSFLALSSAIIIGNIAGLIPLTISGVGLRDATIFAILAAAGIDKYITIPLLYTALILSFNILAGLFYVFDSKKKAVDFTR